MSPGGNFFHKESLDVLVCEREDVLQSDRSPLHPRGTLPDAPLCSIRGFEVSEHLQRSKKEALAKRGKSVVRFKKAARLSYAWETAQSLARSPPLDLSSAGGRARPLTEIRRELVRTACQPLSRGFDPEEQRRTLQCGPTRHAAFCPQFDGTSHQPCG